MRTYPGTVSSIPGASSENARGSGRNGHSRKTCFAFKIMAAGRIGDSGADDAFRQAFASIKPTDGIFVGVFPRVKDEVRENAERVCRILRSA
jgi:hypothetical protein